MVEKNGESTPGTGNPCRHSDSTSLDSRAVRARRLRRDREARLQRCETELGACLWTGAAKSNPTPEL